MKVAHDIRFSRSLEVLDRRAGDDVLVTSLNDQQLHRLTGGAVAVWVDLCAPRTLPDLVSRLALAHDVDTERIAADVGACLDALLALGIVEEVQDFDL